MPFELLHFRDSDKIIRKKKLDRDVKATLEGPVMKKVEEMFKQA